MSKIFPLVLLCVALSAQSNGVQANTTQVEDLQEAIAKDYKANLEPLFVHFHKNPELSFREFETAKRLAKELRALGYQVTEGIGQTGVVAVLKNGKGPTLMLRADMDGLPIKEDSGLTYASKVTQKNINDEEQPVMHACGHDVHITSLVGTARQLMQMKKQWSGTLILIAQPAEERGAGARAMLQDGLYERFPKPDYAVAFHVSANEPSGKIQVSLDSVYSSVDTVDIVVHGIGTHGAAPHKGVDPVLVASQIVVSLQSVVSRSIPPRRHGVITVGAIKGGSKHNIIGDRVDLQLTVRSDDEETRTLLLDGIDRVAKGVALSLGVPENLLPEVTRSTTDLVPPTVNDEETASKIKTAFIEHFPDGTVYDAERDHMGGEDFSYFVEEKYGVKGVYFIVGGSTESDPKNAPSHHSPFFKVDAETAIQRGTEAMVVAALSLLKTP